jgi:hypothetical protein
MGFSRTNPMDQNSMNCCGAKLRKMENLCRCWPIRGKSRCRLHGGLSCGPKTPAGKDKSRRNALRTGLHSKTVFGLVPPDILAYLRWGVMGDHFEERVGEYLDSIPDTIQAVIIASELRGLSPDARPEPMIFAWTIAWTVWMEIWGILRSLAENSLFHRPRKNPLFSSIKRNLWIKNTTGPGPT